MYSRNIIRNPKRPMQEMGSLLRLRTPFFALLFRRISIPPRVNFPSADIHDQFPRPRMNWIVLESGMPHG